MARVEEAYKTPTAHEELKRRINTIDRDIERATADIQHHEKSAAEQREYLAQLEGLKVDYENVIMLAFSKSVA